VPPTEQTPKMLLYGMCAPIRILFLADSHLGFDLPSAPRVQRRRRGADFLANYAAALEPARAGAVDLVVHGGDVFDRPDVPPSLAYQALEPLAQIADGGVPVFVVPGNHERSRLPHERFASHPRIHVFDRPRTFTVELGGGRLALSGFPYQRRGVRAEFGRLIEATKWRRTPASHRLLCVHHCVEGATVGPGDFTFTTANDVIRIRDIPSAFTAVLSGHIHRHQVLTRDLKGRSVATPVLYPGSIERTSLAEHDETKGFMLLELAQEERRSRVSWEFRPLPTRPMIVREVAAGGVSAQAVDAHIRRTIDAAPTDAVLVLRITGAAAAADRRVFSEARIRKCAPDTMTVEVRTDLPFAGRRRAAPARERVAQTPAQQEDRGVLELGL
jgi:DNA repair protein SbcD/Mre11